MTQLGWTFSLYAGCDDSDDAGDDHDGDNAGGDDNDNDDPRKRKKLKVTDILIGILGPFLRFLCIKLSKIEKCPKRIIF